MEATRVTREWRGKMTEVRLDTVTDGDEPFPTLDFVLGGKCFSVSTAEELAVLEPYIGGERELCLRYETSAALVDFATNGDHCFIEGGLEPAGEDTFRIDYLGS